MKWNIRVLRSVTVLENAAKHNTSLSRKKGTRAIIIFYLI